MIRAQRRRHRLAFFGLALVVPGLLAVALSGRPDETPVGELPAWLEEPSRTALRAAPGDAEPEAPVVERLEADRARLTLPADWNLPDALAYWSAEAGAAGDALPAAARLVGALDARAAVELTVPAGAGHLWIYAAAEGRVDAVLPVPEASR